MSEWMALFLAVLQVATEFLPVSSSGHLVLAQEVFQVEHGTLTFDILVHVGTLLSVFIVFWNQLWRLVQYAFRDGWVLMKREGAKAAWHTNPQGNLIVGIIVATIPTGIIGLLGKDYFEKLFSSLESLGWQFMITGVALAITLFIKGKPEPFAMPAPESSSGRIPIAKAGIPLYAAFIIGIMQAVAIVPAISRSGMTIAAALILGLGRRASFEFSFLISIPAILGALLLEGRNMTSGEAFSPTVGFIGLAASALTGWICLILLRKMVQSGAFGFFCIYCFAIGIWAIFRF